MGCHVFFLLVDLHGGRTADQLLVTEPALRRKEPLASTLIAMSQGKPVEEPGVSTVTESEEDSGNS